ncbi:hypothetical protein EON65_31160 [archaeon]|nr:MAG: hypothetical protein EON65_31160 [archaeon]
MRETVSIHVGQCGNQIGSAFWDLLLLEHERTPDNDMALSSFFCFSPSPSHGNKRVMKARALLVDMECGVLQETMKGPLADLFDQHQYLYDVSGAGNNFAQGYYQYGPQYREKIVEGLRHNAEQCESLQTYLVTHSLGGGTGSGVGSYLLGVLSDEYPKVARFAMSVFPSGDSDVITSPYNTVLATQQLLEHCDCVFPVRNQALYSFYQAEHGPAKAEVENQGGGSKSKRSRGFDEVRSINVYGYE